MDLSYLTAVIPCLILAHFQNAQAIYLFGSSATGTELPGSDVDIATLLPPMEASHIDRRAWEQAWLELECKLGRDVDLVNLRRAPVVLQKEIILAEQRIFCADGYAADEFEGLVISLYQKLNQERADILAEGLHSGRFYNV
jgi:predicted nucleotidyltransferase